MDETKAIQVVLAPLRGVTDAVFRTTFAEHFSGFDWAVTPFLSTTKGPRIKPSHLKDVLPENNPHIPLVPQIMSKSADNFLMLAKALLDMGYNTVNWNLGCPYPMVAKKGRGSGLLPHADRIAAFLERVLAVIPDRLSIKLRLGRQHANEIDALLPIFNQLPIRHLIIHPRTGLQMYDGRPDLEGFARCLHLSTHPVIYNGDIASPQDYEALQLRFPEVTHWMIGRCAISDPYLPGMIKGDAVPIQERVQQFRKFHDRLYERYREKLYGPSHLLNRMKGLWGYFAASFQNGAQLRKKINKTQKPAHYGDLLDHFFATDPQWLGGKPKLFGHIF